MHVKMTVSLFHRQHPHLLTQNLTQVGVKKIAIPDPPAYLMDFMETVALKVMSVLIGSPNQLTKRQATYSTSRSYRTTVKVTQVCQAQPLMIKSILFVKLLRLTGQAVQARKSKTRNQTSQSIAVEDLLFKKLTGMSMVYEESDNHSELTICLIPSSLRSSYSRLTSWMVKKNKKSKTKHSKRSSRSSSISNGHTSEPLGATSCNLQNDPMIDSFVKLLKDETPREVCDSFIKDGLPIVIMYSSMAKKTPSGSNTDHQSEQNAETEGIFFCYPAVDASKPTNDGLERTVAIIAKLKGMFITLNDIVHGITNQMPVVTTITVPAQRDTQTTDEGFPIQGGDTLDFRMNDENYIVGQTHGENETLIIAVPEEFDSSVMKVSKFSAVLSRTLTYIYGSLNSAFKVECLQDRIARLLDVISFVLKYRITCFGEAFAAQRLIVEDDELLLTISETLSEYESMNWLHRIPEPTAPMTETTVGSRPDDFVVVGTALFSKGFLISTHLPSAFLSNLIEWLHLRGFLLLSQICTTKTISWSKIFPERVNSSDQRSSFYLLVVIVKQTLFSVLLEVPFNSMASKITANEEIIIQTLRFVISNLDRSGIMADIDEIIAFQMNHHESIIGKLYDEMIEPTQRSRVRSSLKTLSIRDMLSPRDEPIPGSSNSKSYRTSLNPSCDSSSTKSCSTPTLLQSVHSLSSHVLISAPKDPTGRLSPSSPEVILRHGPYSFHSREDSCSMTHSTTYSSCSDRNHNVSLKDCSSYFRLRLPGNLIFFIDYDVDTKCFVGDTLQVRVPSQLHSNNCHNNELTQRQQFLQHLLETFRKTCIRLHNRLSGNQLSITEHGIEVTVNFSHQSVKNQEEPSSSRDVKLRKHVDDKLHSRFWISYLLKSSKREVYACFSLPHRRDNNSNGNIMITSMEEFATSLHFVNQDI